MAKKNALGKGLSALLGNETQVVRNEKSSPALPADDVNQVQTIGNVAGAIARLNISDIVANPFQPRTHFDEQALNELAQSIEKLGIIQPITVRKVSAKRYELISGERRFRASQLAELEQIPAYIRTADDQAMLEMALVENIQRENLDAIEVAISYKRLIEECDLTQEELSGRVGKNRSTISNYLRLLNLPAEIQMGIIEKKLSMGHARALVTIKDPEVQMTIFKRILAEDLSVRAVEQLARESDEDKKKDLENKKASLSFEMQKIRADLRIKFGRAVQLRADKKGGGKIEIGYISQEDLNEVLRLLDVR
ncbi:MAG: ParB/RepB/Spo0J family partition protein [Flavobacteriales bacterium]|nr:ParB/RepB/Spo0J family partition protein [Flavobacteriales bacterium]